jgi:heme-degrading monooxygenase HmoA
LTQEYWVGILFLHDKKEGYAMFVRQTIIRTATDKIDEAAKLFEASVIPAFRSQNGYRGAYFISDRKSGKSICVSLWDSEEDALANEQSHVYQEQLIKFMKLFTTDPFREGYELLVQDVK